MDVPYLKLNLITSINSNNLRLTDSLNFFRTSSFKCFKKNALLINIHSAPSEINVTLVDPSIPPNTKWTNPKTSFEYKC